VIGVGIETEGGIETELVGGTTLVEAEIKEPPRVDRLSFRHELSTGLLNKTFPSESDPKTK
jgi:hypothetical protein